MTMGHSSGGQGVGGSNPLAPTIFSNIAKHLGRSRLFARRKLVARSAANPRPTVHKPPHKPPHGVPRAFSRLPPPGALAGFLSAAEFGFDGFAEKVRFAFQWAQDGNDARNRSSREPGGHLLMVDLLASHVPGISGGCACGQQFMISPIDAEPDITYLDDINLERKT